MLAKRRKLHVVVFFLPAVSYTEDIWSETPSLETSYRSPDFRSSLIRLGNGVSVPEIWAETPDLSAISETVRLDFLEDDKVVSSIDHEMYTETQI